jgi:toxin HigB-1
MQIRSFRHKSLDRLWRRGDVRGIPAAWVEKVRAMLTAIEEAGSIDDIARFPEWKLHQLKGDRNRLGQCR